MAPFLKVDAYHLNELARILYALIISTLLISPAGWAQGYYVDEQSAKRLGDAFSGGAAEALDASTAFYNPAGLTRLRQTELVLGLGIVNASFDIEAQGNSLQAINDTGTPDTNPIQGIQNESVTNTAYIPHAYLALPIDTQWSLGLSLNTPYASGSEFDRRFVGRYFSSRSEILGINTGLMIALKVSDALSIGGGVNIQHFEGEIERDINTAGFCAGSQSLGLLGNDSCTGLGIGISGSAMSDGRIKIEGDDTAVGYTLGLLLETSPSTRIGLNFRSAIEHELKGSAEFFIPPNVETAIGFLDPDLRTRRTGARVKLITPESASASFYHELNPRWAVQIDVSWINWSRFKELTIEIQDTMSRDSTAQNWKDSWRLALGGSYGFHPRWTARAGMAYATTPIPDETVSLDFPYDDYRAISLGLSYQPIDSLTVDLGAQYTLPATRKLRVGSIELTDDAATLEARVKTSIYSMALGMRWRF